MNADQLKVRDGESVQEAWLRLVAWVESLKIVNSPDVIISETTKGLKVKVLDHVTFYHPFLVMASPDYASVSAGTVNNLTPMMKDSESGKLERIDGRDKNGAIVSGFMPRMKIDIKKASKDGRVYICVKVKRVATVNGKAAELKNEDIEIVQSDSAKGPQDGSGYYALAMIYLTPDRSSVENIFQITHHNLRYVFQERKASNEELKESPAEKTIGRHVFYPA